MNYIQHCQVCTSSSWSIQKGPHLDPGSVKVPAVIALITQREVMPNPVSLRLVCVVWICTMRGLMSLLTESCTLKSSPHPVLFMMLLFFSTEQWEEFCFREPGWQGHPTTWHWHRHTPAPYPAAGTHRLRGPQENQ